MKLVYMSGLMMALLAISCGPALVSEYTRLGQVDQAMLQSEVVVPIMDDVKVYFMSLPDGFSITDEGVEAKAGTRHIVLGEVVVKVARCNERVGVRHAIIQALQQKAFDVGANAVIYVAVQFLESYNEKVCLAAVATKKAVGRGWAVIILED